LYVLPPVLAVVVAGEVLLTTVDDEETPEEVEDDASHAESLGGGGMAGLIIIPEVKLAFNPASKGSTDGDRNASGGGGGNESSRDNCGLNLKQESQDASEGTLAMPVDEGEATMESNGVMSEAESTE